jgi:hypothetical protein
VPVQKCKGSVSSCVNLLFDPPPAKYSSLSDAISFPLHPLRNILGYKRAPCSCLLGPGRSIELPLWHSVLCAGRCKQVTRMAGRSFSRFHQSQRAVFIMCVCDCDKVRLKSGYSPRLGHVCDQTPANFKYRLYQGIFPIG